MARFFAEVKGNARTTASRTGTKSSGISASVNGWDIGVDVRLFVNEDGDDEVVVYLTKGSNGGVSDVEIIFQDADQKEQKAMLDLSDAFFRLVVPRVKIPNLETNK